MLELVRARSVATLSLIGWNLNVQGVLVIVVVVLVLFVLDIIVRIVLVVVAQLDDLSLGLDKLVTAILVVSVSSSACITSLAGLRVGTSLALLV